MCAWSSSCWTNADSATAWFTSTIDAQRVMWAFRHRAAENNASVPVATIAA
jgi:hypothetical protein